MKKKLMAFIAAALVGITLTMSPVRASADCTPTDPTTEVIEHPAATHEETITVVDVPETTEVIPATPDLWWNWSPNKDQGPFDGPPDFPVDPRGTWEGPHENGGPSQDTYGTFQQGNGNGSWFHREHGTPEQTIVTPAVTHEETVTVVDVPAYTETITHPGTSCPTPPKTTPPAEQTVVKHHVVKHQPQHHAAVPVVVEAGL